MEPSIPDELTCTICLSLLCEPVFWPSATTSSCHHSFCRLCAFKVLRVSQNPTCPLCREPAANLSQLEAGDLNLDGPKYRQVLKAFPIPHNKQKRENRRELARLQGGEAEMPLHVVGEYALRKGTTIALRIEPEDCGLFTKVLMSNTRSLALVLGHTATVGAVARSARVLGYAGRSFEYEEAHREISFLLAQGSPLKLHVGALACIVSQPTTRQANLYNAYQSARVVLQEPMRKQCAERMRSVVPLPPPPPPPEMPLSIAMDTAAVRASTAAAVLQASIGMLLCVLMYAWPCWLALHTA